MKRTGFGLIELLVVLAITAMLASMIVPGYQQEVLRSYRLEARQALLKVAGLQELMLADQQRYTADLTELGFASQVVTTDSGRYQLRVRLTEQGYVLEAHAIAAQREDQDCLHFELNSMGLKRSAPLDSCWQS